MDTESQWPRAYCTYTLSSDEWYYLILISNWAEHSESRISGHNSNNEKGRGLNDYYYIQIMYICLVVVVRQMNSNMYV